MTTKYLYIMGSASGAGKTTLCEGLLAQLLLDGYQPEQLAYIKPMTQCTDKQAVTIFCESKHIAHRSITSLVFKKGFSKNFIDGLSKNSSLLLEDILAEITQISTGKDIVIVDGVGGPSTGSVIGVSNVDIALSLNAPVLFVGKPGIGAAIDDTVLALSFMQQQGIKNIALVYNKIPAAKLISIKYYVSKRLAELLPNIPVLDFIIDYRQLDSEAKLQSARMLSQWLHSHIFR
ncbi:MAG: AAA family ATPase [Methyloprofundus sp.]|nr:AAA family ATPase [Methyloprofundus sp.]